MRKGLIILLLNSYQLVYKVLIYVIIINSIIENKKLNFGLIASLRPYYEMVQRMDLIAGSLPPYFVFSNISKFSD